jgi:hypothetical protein
MTSVSVPPLFTEAAHPLNIKTATAQDSAIESLDVFIEFPYPQNRLREELNIPQSQMGPHAGRAEFSTITSLLRAKDGPAKTGTDQVRALIWRPQNRDLSLLIGTKAALTQAPMGR